MCGMAQRQRALQKISCFVGDGAIIQNQEYKSITIINKVVGLRRKVFGNRCFYSRHPDGASDGIVSELQFGE